MRSFLFVPGDSEKKLDKSRTSGADTLLIDLEDSISPERKAVARATTIAFLKDFGQAIGRPRLFVRVNGLATGLTDADLAVMEGRPDGIVLPKAEGGAALVHLDAKLGVAEARHDIPDGQTRILALTTETAKSLFLAGTYAGATARLMGLTWGGEDLSVALGAEANRGEDGRFLDPYRLARSLCLAAAAACEVQALDTVYIDFRNTDGLRREAEEARRDGFTGKMAIHPGQVEIINAVFTPTSDAIARAKAVVAAFAAEPAAGVVGIDGVMYDRPHLARAQQLLARAEAAGAKA